MFSSFTHETRPKNMKNALHCPRRDALWRDLILQRIRMNSTNLLASLTNQKPEIEKKLVSTPASGASLSMNKTKGMFRRLSKIEQIRLLKNN